MKKYIPTLLLVVICIGLFWYTGGHNFYEATAESQQKLFAFNRDDVKNLTVKWNEQEVDVNRQDDNWVMEKPAAYPVNENMVSSWLDALSSITQDMVVEENASDLGKYGLEKPSGEYEVKLKDGSEQLLLIGDELAVNGYYYAAVDQSRRVYRVGASAVEALQKEPLQFIARTPVSFDSDTVSSLQFHWKQDKWALTKTDLDQTALAAKWRLGDQELDGSKANMLLDKVLFLATEELMKPATDIAMKAPDLTIEIKTSHESETGSMIYHGKLDGNKVWIVKQGGQWAYAVPLADVQQAFEQVKDMK
ncbi:DUF4340 domain-containing protein [Paenibacillus sp. KN14-4R]|uniref:DUF4340 domain-containing protein n=1 Tax=Paenibacillus sp. KN14-4R TaxID=3445773 RepID=UPI003FA18292